MTDTCFWLGLVDNADQHHNSSLAINELIKGHYIIFPFPSFYEIIRTRFLKDKRKLIALENFLKNSAVQYIDDTKYKDNALINVYKNKNATYSLTDAVIREMLSDINLKFDYLVTFNEKDFFDICNKRNIEILSSS